MARSLACPGAFRLLANRGPRRAALTTAAFPGGPDLLLPGPAGPAVEAGGGSVQYLAPRHLVRVPAAHSASLPAGRRKAAAAARRLRLPPCPSQPRNPGAARAAAG